MNKYKRLISDTFLFAIGSFGSKLILFFLVPLYTNYLTTGEYGTAELIYTVANLIMPITSMVIFDAVLRFALDKKTNNKNVLLNAVIVWGIGSAISLAIAPLFGLYQGLSEWKWYISIYIIITMACQICMIYIKAKEKSKQYVLLSLLQTLLLAVLNIVLLTVFHLHIYGYLWANIVAHVIILALAVKIGDILKDLKSAVFEKELFKEMLKYSTPLIINNISWWIVQSSDKLMVEGLLDSASLGLYSVASKIPALINVITTIFSQAWGISSIKEYDSNKDKKFYSVVFGLYSFIVFFTSSCILLIIKRFMKIYVGQDFFEAWKYVPWLLVAASFGAISSYFGAIYGAVKKSFNVMISTLFSAIINIIINFILIPKIGIMGATIATAVSYIFIAWYRIIDSRRYFKFSISFTTIIVESLLICIQTYFVINEQFNDAISIMIIMIIILININRIKELLGFIKGFLKGERKDESN